MRLALLWHGVGDVKHWSVASYKFWTGGIEGSLVGAALILGLGVMELWLSCMPLGILRKCGKLGLVGCSDGKGCPGTVGDYGMMRAWIWGAQMQPLVRLSVGWGLKEMVGFRLLKATLQLRC